MNLAIYGAGGLGGKILDLVYLINKTSQKYEKIYFVDDFDFNRIVYDIPVLSFEYLCKNFSKENLQFVIAVGEPKNREVLKKKIVDTGFSLETLISPLACVSKYAKIEEGCIIFNFSNIETGSEIKENCVINPFCQIAHEAIIGENSFLASGTTLGGNVQIGKNCFIGLSSTLREKTVIGDNAIVGMGSNVTKSFGQGVIVFSDNSAKIKGANMNRSVFKNFEWGGGH